ncbi:unnamed protein product [Lepeophtheirus salmonis]|uniref:(salmon louse) hypothetical protein n=1 Tax=Lepeophtheirus salmonis TaxID=72036 RepID=A0A7R8D3L3_LEPSM|nr:unnamed protein product [Lepeophtheirus salmonis]CAF3014974.1 unnamed protein product [Lepeophtheirus salmonis]
MLSRSNSAYQPLNSFNISFSSSNNHRYYKNFITSIKINPEDESVPLTGESSVALGASQEQMISDKFELTNIAVISSHHPPYRTTTTTNVMNNNANSSSCSGAGGPRGSLAKDFIVTNG